MTTNEFREYVKSIFPAKRFKIFGQIYNDRRKDHRRFKVYMKKSNNEVIDSFDLAVVKTMIKKTGLELYSQNFWDGGSYQRMLVFIYRTEL